MEIHVLLPKGSVFKGRILPEEGLLVGYGAIIHAFDLQVPLPLRLALVSTKKRHYKKEGWQVFSTGYFPGNSIYKQLVFALKYEGINLLVLKKIFIQIGENQLVELLKEAPLGQYSRKLWFLYEWLFEMQLPIPKLQTGNYVNLLDDKLQYSLSNGVKSKRHRIINNLPGTLGFCPLIYKTEKLERYIVANLGGDANNYLQSIHKDVLQRTTTFLLLKDSKASFTIEGESPKSNRAVRWGQVIGQAGNTRMSKEQLLQLQIEVIENARFVNMGFRQKGGFIGEHDQLTGQPIPEHISAKGDDVIPLIDGLLATYEQLLTDDFDAVMAAAMIAFGFVFIHPFQDGNGRIHRYLIQDLLAKKRFSAQGIIFPISASILNSIDDYREVLQVYSHSILSFIEWKETNDHNVDVIGDTIDFYRYFDATTQAEFLYDCVNNTIQEIIPTEVDYLLKYDAFKQYLVEEFDMNNQMVALLIRFLSQNNGMFSKRALKKEFIKLTSKEVGRIEEEFKNYF